MVSVYSTPDCQQCKATVRLLDRQGIPHRVAMYDDSPEIQALAVENGYKQAPVVVTDDGKHWSGFRPDLIRELV